jgi:hypothetical protein
MSEGLQIDRLDLHLRRQRRAGKKDHRFERRRRSRKKALCGSCNVDRLNIGGSAVGGDLGGCALQLACERSQDPVDGSKESLRLRLICCNRVGREKARDVLSVDHLAGSLECCHDLGRESNNR